MSCAILLAAMVAPAAAAASSADKRDVFFDYLHIEANSGNASGGHAAICFDDRCFHFQQGDDRTIRLHRDSALQLDHTYRALGNRTIHAYRVPVSSGERARILDAFEGLYRKQQHDFAPLETLHEDRGLLEQLAGNQNGDAPGTTSFRVPGSAYFLASEPFGSAPVSAEFLSAGASRSTAIERVARRIRARYGASCLQLRSAALGVAVRDLLEGGMPTTPAAAATGDDELPAFGLAGRYRELLSAWLAVEVLRAAPPLRPASMIVAPVSRLALEQRDWGAIEQFQAQLEDALVELYGSKRSDWGYPMLVGLARVAGFEEALSRRELVVLDVFREDAEVVPASELSAHRRRLGEVLRERYADLGAARAAFLDDASEMHWSRFETAANLAAELEHALEQGKPLRVHHGAPVPMKSAVRGDWPRPHAQSATLARLVAITRNSTQRLDDELANAYGYDLVRRNCVTEILGMLESMDADSPDATSADRHANWSMPGLAGSLRFIPFVSAYLVSSRPGALRVDRPSYRQLVLARMESSNNRLLVDLRESNVLTSTIYEPNINDPLFLFFTDDSLLLRPLQGVANLTISAAAVAAGAVLLPVDMGTTLRRALEGVASSLPEVFFVNVRKGSFPFAPYSWLEEARWEKP